MRVCDILGGGFIAFSALWFFSVRQATGVGEQRCFWTVFCKGWAQGSCFEKAEHSTAMKSLGLDYRLPAFKGLLDWLTSCVLLDRLPGPVTHHFSGSPTPL